ncbi:hypothetical protein ACOACO_13180 [Nocardioides sp. CPCC 205120]|uniref:hypothetical protein n=1 Tax=Nocardioides sp. CPCC 205120 TaxID=3406462 RepID=UPI003B500362
MDWTVTTYLGYLAIAIPLTVWVARTLFTNGTVFLTDVFEGRHELAAAVNRLLVVGFYLLNVGFVLLFLRVGDPVLDASGMLEVLSVKLGVVMLVLGGVHLANVLVFNSIRRRHHYEQGQRPPVAPQGVLGAGPRGPAAPAGPAGPADPGALRPFPAPGR